MSVWGDKGTAHGWLSYALGDDQSDQHSLLFARHGQVPAASLSDFRYIRNLGLGTWGAVVLVSLAGTYEVYAMKVMEKETLIKTEMVEQSVEEQVLQGAASASPLVVNLRYAFQTEHKICIVMDYLPGGDLFRLLSRQPRNVFSEATAKFYAAETSLAILHLHRMGIIYRDMKLENVLLSADGHVRLTDFGLAKKIFSKRTSTIVGTPEYMAPEILLSKAYDTRVDWWAFGVCLFVMMVGKYPNTSSPIANQIPANLDLSISCIDIMQALLTEKPKKRLAGREVIKHAWFADYDFDVLEAFGYEPPLAIEMEPLPDPNDLGSWPILTEDLLDSYFTPVTAATPAATGSSLFADNGGATPGLTIQSVTERMQHLQQSAGGKGSRISSLAVVTPGSEAGSIPSFANTGGSGGGSRSKSLSNLNRAWARSTPDLSSFVSAASQVDTGSHDTLTPLPTAHEFGSAGGTTGRHGSRHHSRHSSRSHGSSKKDSHGSSHGSHKRHNGGHRSHHHHHHRGRRHSQTGLGDDEADADSEKGHSRSRSRSHSRSRSRKGSSSPRQRDSGDHDNNEDAAGKKGGDHELILKLKKRVSALEGEKRALAATVATQGERIRLLQVTTSNYSTEINDLREAFKDLETRFSDFASLTARSQQVSPNFMSPPSPEHIVIEPPTPVARSKPSRSIASALGLQQQGTASSSPTGVAAAAAAPDSYDDDDDFLFSSYGSYSDEDDY